ncbi:6230_t:CDS:2, partial [Gigaspora margarita]
MVKWYEKCINQMQEKRIQIENLQNRYLVKEIGPKLEDDNFKEIKEINSDYSLFKNIWTRINPSIDIGLQRKKIDICNLNQQIRHFKKYIEQLESELEQSFKDGDLIEDNLLETKYKKCNDIYKYTNEKKIWFTKATATAGFTEEIFHNTLQSSLATIRITSQIGKKIYNNYQKLYFSSLIASAKSSTTQALQKCIEYAMNQNKEALAIGFNFQKSRSIKDNKTELTKTIYQGIKVLNQISSPLEENNLHLDICVDSDLNSNKTLAHVHIVSKILADLKHLTKHIRNSVLKLRREAKDQSALSKAKTYKMQVDSLIRYLQNNYSSCWSDVCWTKDVLTIIIQKPTLCYSSESQINFLINFLKKFFVYLL